MERENIPLHFYLMNIENLSKKIKQAGHNLGFDLVGITNAGSPESFPLYENWVKAGNHAEMGYLSSERALYHRADLQKVLPDCQSVLVLAKIINPSIPISEKRDHHGRIASYAWNLDYHDIFIPLLRVLLQQIEDISGKPVNGKYYTDTGPILERELASRAGLGWIGKNSMLINPQVGSFFLISEILLDLKLKPDKSFNADHCGTCRKCIEACPTNCILPNRTIDSRRCLSYLTIELKDAIPPDLRTQMNEWIFGCDICQQVCPWNQQFSQPTTDSSFSPRTEVPIPDLLKELKLTPEEFNRKFKGSPVKRAKRRGYLRNIITILGNMKNENLIHELSKLLLNDPEALVRQHAAWALGQIGGDDSLNQLERALHSEKDDQVIEEINLTVKMLKPDSF